jgi:hypothetical protein
MAYTTIDDPSAYFQTKLYTGTGSSLAITNDGNSNLQPDLVWLKRRDGSTYDHRWNDSVRGVSKTIYSSDNFAENTSDAQVVTSFDSNGFTLGTSAGSNASGVNNVAWQWKASGSTASNTDGSITSTVSANTTAGFSIVSWTGTGANATIGHGLGAEPKMIFLKIRTGTNNWQVYNKSIGSGNALFLNTTDASGSNTGWQSTDATSSVFYVSGGTAVNGSGASLIAYCFAEKKGYSKIGSYTGNGNTDGIFVYTGFKPAWVMIKNSSHARDWIMMDNKRDPDNVVSNRLFPNNTDAQNTNNDMLDFTSNGFKIRNTNTTANLNGGTYIYMAFAESPFVTGASAIPTTAR